MNEHIKQFDIARKLYPGSKAGNANEFKNFVTNSLYPLKGKCKYDIKAVIPLLLSAIKLQIQWRDEAKGEFRPEWKGFSKWINDQWWEFEPPTKAVQAPDMCCVCGGNAEPHHVRSVGSGGSDLTCVPLCRRHHTEAHQSGKSRLQAKYSVDLELINEIMVDKYERR